MHSTLKETRVVKGRVLDYVGMSFDFTKRGEVKVTMGNCVSENLLILRKPLNFWINTLIDS